MSPFSRALTIGLALTLSGAVASLGMMRLAAEDMPAIPRPEPAPPSEQGSTTPSGAKTDSPSPGEGDEEETSELETETNNLGELVPIGRVFEGVKIPSYSGDTLSSVVHANFMRRADDEHLEMEMLEIVVYSGEEPDSRILTDRAIYDMEDKTLRSSTPAKIIQKQFEMTGDRMLFDSTTRIGHLSGNVKTRIYQVDQLMNSGAK